MNLIERYNWCELMKQGVYLVCTTPTAVTFIEEQRLKHKAPLDATHVDVEMVFHDYHITYGTPYLAYRKLLAIFATLLQKDDDTAYKEFTFILLTLLGHSTYKTLIKAIEKKSNRLDDEDAFFAFIEQLEDPYIKETYRLLFSFTFGVNRMRSCILKKALEERYMLAQQVEEQNNRVSDLIKARTSAVANDDMNEPIPKALLTESVIAELAAHGIYVQDISDICLTETQLKRATTENIALMIVVNQLKQFSDRLLAQPVIEKEPSQKVITKKVVKKPASTTKLEKDIERLKLQLADQQSHNATLSQTIEQLKQENHTLQQDIYKLEEDQETLESLLDGPTISENATAIVEDLQHNLARLVSELNLKPIESTISALDEMKHLKVAVVGGHPKYHAQLKQDWPTHILTIGPDEMNFDQKKLKKYDVIVLSSSHSSHSLYERAFDYLKGQNMKHKCLQLDTQKNAKALAAQIIQFRQK